MTTTHHCAWPKCGRAISWRLAFCYRHWKRIPARDRERRVAEVLEETR